MGCIRLLRLIGWVEIMGCWDEYCVVCGGPPCDPDPEVYYDAGSGGEGETEVNAKGPSALNRQDWAWLRSFVGVNEAEELVPLGGYADYGYFYVAGGATRFGGATNVRHLHEVEPNLYGLVAHERCYRALQRDLQYTLRFRDVWPMLMQQEVGGYLEDYTDYGGMRPYQSQFFRFVELFLDKKEWMLQDPMAHRENAERILQVWRPIVESGFKVSKRKQPKPDAAKEGVAALEQGSGF